MSEVAMFIWMRAAEALLFVTLPWLGVHLALFGPFLLERS